VAAWNSEASFRLILPELKEAAMLVERGVQVLNVEVVGEAYDIAAYYLSMTGMIAPNGQINERLLEIVYNLFDSGVRNRLLLANKAITKFERSRPQSYQGY
jgi:hypothetical protein